MTPLDLSSSVLIVVKLEQACWSQVQVNAEGLRQRTF